MHSSGNLFQSFTTLWGNVYFLISNLEWLFTKARLCPLVMLSFFKVERACAARVHVVNVQNADFLFLVHRVRLHADDVTYEG